MLEAFPAEFLDGLAEVGEVGNVSSLDTVLAEFLLGGDWGAELPRFGLYLRYFHR